MVLATLLKMHMPESMRARWTARESMARPLTYGQPWDDIEVSYGLNSRRERRTAWNALAPTFSGKLIDRAGWKIYIAEFERLARALDIPEEEKVRRRSLRGGRIAFSGPRERPTEWSWAACPRVPPALKPE